MRVLRLLRNLRRNQDGNLPLELITVVPTFGLVIMLSVTAYGYFKAQGRDAKAAFAISDAISRETNNITPAYLDTFQKMHAFLTGATDGAGYRISVVDYDPWTQDYRIRWNASRADDKITIPESTVATLRPRMPKLADYEAVIVLETYVNHRPFKEGFGMAPVTFRHVTITRPRHGPQICFSTDTTNPSSTDRTC